MATALTRFHFGWSAADTTPPSTPTGFQVQNFGGFLDITWNSSTDNVTPTASIVYELDVAPDVTGSPGTYTNTGTLPAGQNYAVHWPGYGTYWYRVRAKDQAGNYSGYATQSIVIAYPTPGQVALNASNVTATTATINLTPVGDANADTFEFQRNGVTVQNTAAQTLNDTGLSTGITYTYRARGVNQWNVGPWSSNLLVSTNTPPVASFTVTPNPAPEGATMTLTSTSTDVDGTIASYQWELVSAPEGYTGTFSAPTSSTTTFTPTETP